MRLLEERIEKEGRILPGGIIKVDGFLNHRIDIDLAEKMADEFYRLFGDRGINKVVTVEASGIAIAAIVARRFGVPMVFAKKAKSDNIEGGLYKSEIFSYTYKKKFTLIVSKDWLGEDDVVLVVDDFLANGEALRGLIDIVSESGAKLAAVGVCVEKGFQRGGKTLREKGIPLKSLAIIEQADENGFVFREDV